MRGRARLKASEACLPLLLGAVLLSAGASEAKPRLAIIPFGHYPVERQLTQTLCAEVTCIPASQVMRQGHVDWDRVAAAHLTAVLTGKIVKDPNTQKRLVDVQLLAPGKVILVRKRARLSSMALSTAALHTLTVDLVGVLNRAHGPERDATAVPGAAAAGAVAGAAAKPGVAAAPPGASPSAPAPDIAAASAAAAAGHTELVAEPESGPAVQEERAPSLLEVQVTFALLGRNYSYSASGSNTTLRDSSIPLAAEPSLLVSVFPFRSPTGFFESFGIEAGVATSVGMAVQRQNDTTGTLFPAVSVAANVGLLARLRVSKSLRLAPMLGWQMMNLTVNKAADGTVLTGEPTVHWRAFRVGLTLDWDVNNWFSCFADAAYLYVYSAGPLTSAPYFTSFLSAPSFDTALGVGFRVSPHLQIRLGFFLTRYALSFSGPGPAPVNGVSDQLLGATLGFRYSE